MHVSARMVRLVFEASEIEGIPGKELAVVLGPSALDPRLPGELDWTSFVTLLERLAVLLGRDVERIRRVGRRMVRAPENAVLRQLARSVLSARRLYELGTRWLAPASFAHLPLVAEFPSEARMRVRSEIPEGYLPSATFFHVFEGMLAEMPTLCGQAPASIAESRVSPRSLDLVLDFSSSAPRRGRVRRALAAIRRAGEIVEVLEAQRAALAESVLALRRAQNESRALLDRLPDLVVVHVAGKVVWANRAALRALGYERLEEVVGLSLLDLVAPASRPLVESRMNTDPESGAWPELSEVQLLPRGGGSVVVEVAPTQRVEFEGAEARLVVGRDVTERVRMQQRLVTADRLASVGLLAAGVAHEVNNPLAYVLNNVELARRGLAPLGEAAAPSREALDVALEGIERIRAVVRDLLRLARPDDGLVSAVDVQRVLDSILALARDEIDRTARLVRDYEPAPPALASEARLAQVFLNLIVNALQAMRKRPAEENELVVRVAEGEGRVVVEVSDSGEGIAPEHVPRVFEPFFSTKDGGAGTGLGLSITQRLVVELGGDVEVESVPGKGSTFRVLLPVAEAPRDLRVLVSKGAERGSPSP